jgi:hypothetical protein
MAHPNNLGDTCVQFKKVEREIWKRIRRIYATPKKGSKKQRELKKEW